MIKYILLIFIFITGCTSLNHVDEGPKKTVITMVNAIDTKEWNKALDQFSNKVFVDYSSMTKQPGQETASKDLVGGWQRLLKKAETHHMLTNFVVNANLSSAKVTTHVYASHTGKKIKYWDIYGRYLFNLEKIDGDWKITSMTLKVHGQKGNTNFLKEISK